MATWNDITGDPLVSKMLTKEGGDNFEKIFGKRKTNGGWTPPVDTVELTPTAPDKPLDYAEDWQPETRARAIAQNGNSGDHYKGTK